MALQRTADNGIAKANRVILAAQSEKKMTISLTERPEACRESKLKTGMFFTNDDVLFHVVGNSHCRAIFIEHFDRLFDLYRIDTKTTDSNIGTFRFSQHVLSIATARETFRQMGFYYFGYCESKNKVADFLKYLQVKSNIELKDIDTTINRAFRKLASDTLNNSKKSANSLSLFDPENAEQISSAKTKYDLWLEEFQNPDTGKFASIKDGNARKLLQLFQHYLSGGRSGRFLSGHWKRHHCKEVANVLAPYKLMASDETSLAATIATQQIDEEELDIIPLETTQNISTVEDILKSLRDYIENSDEKTIKTHGDLFNLLEIVKDHMQVDYFALKTEASLELAY